MRQERSALRSSPARIRRYGLVSFAVALAVSVIGLPAAAQAASGHQLRITAMTYNLFQGTELTEASSATTPAQFLAAVAADYGEVQTTDFPSERRPSPSKRNRPRPT